MFAAAFVLEPEEMLGAWRPEPLLLELISAEPPQLRDRAAVRIEVSGRSVAATVVGTVLSVLRDRSGYSFGLAPDADSMSAVRLLLAAARGENVPFRARATRYLVRLPTTVSFWNAARISMTTFSVSVGGCGLNWSGPLPSVGQAIRLRVEGTTHAAVNQGVIRWRSHSHPASTAGVQIIGSPASGAWPQLVAELARGGAPRA
jgi:hypothetical protein